MDILGLVSFLIGELLDQVSCKRASLSKDGSYAVTVDSIINRHSFPVEEIREQLGGRTLTYVDDCGNRASVHVEKEGDVLCYTEGSEALLLQIMWTRKYALAALKNIHDMILSECHPGKPFVKAIQKSLRGVYINFLQNMR
jgi:hypothetical protein